MIRKNKAAINITIAQNITACQQQWDAILPTQHHLNSAYLQAFELANISDVETNYVIVYIKEKAIGVLYLQQFCFKQQHVNFNHHKAAVSKLLQIVLPKQLPILICGHLFRINFQGFYFKNDAHKLLVFDAIDLFVQLQKNNKPCGIIVKDSSEVFVQQGCMLHGYRFFGGDVTMEVSKRANWHVFDDYINDLQKKYKQRAKKIIQSFKGITTISLNAAEILLHASSIDALYWNVVHKQTIKLGTVNAAYFYQLKISMQQNFECNAMFFQNKMIGFYTYIFYNNSMETHYIGLDYTVNKTHNTYFNILFAGIQKMIEGNYQTLELGRTAKEAKANTGALPKQIFNYIKVKNILINWVINYVVNRFNTAENKKLHQRNPLK